MSIECLLRYNKTHQEITTYSGPIAHGGSFALVMENETPCEEHSSAVLVVGLLVDCRGKEGLAIEMACC
jgi:hypothetical protein